MPHHPLYAALKAAIRDRQALSCRYHGHLRQICPHVLGTKDGEARVLVYQFAGGTDSGLPPGGEWRCLVLRDLSDVAPLDAGWHTAPHAQPQTCIDDVDTEVDA